MTTLQPPHASQGIWHIPLPDEQATATLAQALAHHSHTHPSLRIDLYGDLGAGKTTFVRLLLRALGVEGRIKSPTYALMESYELPGCATPARHFDLYRLETPEEWQESGLEEELNAAGLRLVEWPQKAQPLLPAPDLSLAFCITPQPDTPEWRSLTITSHTAAGTDMAQHVLKATA